MMGKGLRRRNVWWLVTACMLVAVAGLVSSARAARSESTKSVTFHGYKVEVPTSWPVVDLTRNPSACVRFDVHAVYLGHPGASQSCPARVVGRTEALLVEPIDKTSRARVRDDTIWPAKGRAAADDAVVKAGALGIGAGSVIYFDMEGYPNNNPACSQTVLTFLSNWSTRLHELNYLSGVYSSVGSGIRDLVSVYNSTSYVRPDHIWFAH